MLALDDYFKYTWTRVSKKSSNIGDKYNRHVAYKAINGKTYDGFVEHEIKSYTSPEIIKHFKQVDKIKSIAACERIAEYSKAHDENLQKILYQAVKFGVRIPHLEKKIF